MQRCKYVCVCINEIVRDIFYPMYFMPCARKHIFRRRGSLINVLTNIAHSCCEHFVLIQVHISKKIAKKLEILDFLNEVAIYCFWFLQFNFTFLNSILF